MEWRRGDVVTVVGLTNRADLNGLIADIVKRDTRHERRWNVRIQGQDKKLSLREENLVAAATTPHTAGEAAHGASAGETVDGASAGLAADGASAGEIVEGASGPPAEDASAGDAVDNAPHAPQSATFHDRQRVLVRWERFRPGEHHVFAGRVLEVIGEFGRGGRFVQTTVRVLYEVDGRRMWHTLSELSPLDEDALIALPPHDEEDDEVQVVDTRWQLFSLRCCYSLARLTDPARCLACTHPSRCNYDALNACLQGGARACPVAGCAVGHIRSRDIVRDDELRSALAHLPSAAEVCWLRGLAEVQLEAPEHLQSRAAGSRAAGSRAAGSGAVGSGAVGSGAVGSGAGGSGAVGSGAGGGRAAGSEAVGSGAGGNEPVGGREASGCGDCGCTLCRR